MSSDSEDDCYGNVTEKLQKMKDKYLEDKTETVNLLDDSAELDAIVKNCPLPPKMKKKPGRKSLKAAASESVIDLPDVSIDSDGNSNKRVTRSRAKRSNKSAVEVTSPTLQRSPDVSQIAAPAVQSAAAPAVQSAAAPAVQSAAPNLQSPADVSASATNVSQTNRTRGRGRGAGARGRGRRSRGFDWGSWGRQRVTISSLDPTIPTYNVGNTAEYPDQSDSQPLFSNKKTTEDVILIDDNIVEDNEELSVKVYWQNSEFFKFSIRRYQKFSQVFDFFSKKENITHDKLLFTYNDKILKPDDTPESVDYSIVKFIDGGIVTQAVTDLVTRDTEMKDGVRLKFQCQNLKKPFELTIHLDEKLAVAIMKCAEHLEKPVDKLKFEFDGDSISGKTTAREMEFEGGECIDVKILS